MKAVCAHNLEFFNNEAAVLKSLTGRDSTYGGSGFALEIMSDCNANMTQYTS
jgi:hypothetical protein